MELRLFLAITPNESDNKLFLVPSIFFLVIECRVPMWSKEQGEAK